MVLKSVAVTGASGMLGRYILKALHQQGIAARTFSRRRPQNLQPNQQWRSWDLTDQKDQCEIDDFFSDVDAIIHAGAVVPKIEEEIPLSKLFAANVGSTTQIAECATVKGVPLVFISGAIVYDDWECPEILESNSSSGRTKGGFYGHSKWLAEKSLDYFRREGLKLCTLRPSSIYGHGLDAGKMVSKFLSTAQDAGTIVLTPPFDDRVDLVFAADVAAAAISALIAQAWGEFNISSGRMYSIEEIATACISICGHGSVEKRNSPTPRSGTSRFNLSHRSATTKFGYSPRFDLRAGLNEMLQARRDHHDSTPLQIPNSASQPIGHL